MPTVSYRENAIVVAGVHHQSRFIHDHSVDVPSSECFCCLYGFAIRPCWAEAAKSNGSWQAVHRTPKGGEGRTLAIAEYLTASGGISLDQADALRRPPGPSRSHRNCDPARRMLRPALSRVVDRVSRHAGAGGWSHTACHVSAGNSSRMSRLSGSVVRRWLFHRVQEHFWCARGWVGNRVPRLNKECDDPRLSHPLVAHEHLHPPPHDPATPAAVTLL